MERLSPAANAMGVSVNASVSVDLSVCKCGGSTPQAAQQAMRTDGEKGASSIWLIMPKVECISNLRI